MNRAIDLNTRYGSATRNPTEPEMKAAIREVLHEDHPSLTESDYAEHPNSWLSLGIQFGDNWTVFTLDLFRGGRMVFSKYDDQDDAEPVFEHSITRVTEAEALRLWSLLSSGAIESLSNEKWK